MDFLYYLFNLILQFILRNRTHNYQTYKTYTKGLPLGGFFVISVCCLYKNEMLCRCNTTLIEWA